MPHTQDQPAWTMTSFISELMDYLDSLTITSDNIGAIRRSCFVPWKSSWNGIVRDQTARRELPPAAASSPLPAEPPHTCGPPIDTDCMECAYEACPRPRDGCSEYCWQHHKSQCAPAEPRQEGEQEKVFDLDPLEFWCDLAEVLGHPRPTKADVPALVSEVKDRLAVTPPETPSDAAMRAARAIVDYLALPDSQEPADSDGSPTNYIAKIVTRHLVATPVGFIEAFRNTAIKYHGALAELVRLKPRLHDGPLEHQGSWEECDWIECEERRAMIEQLRAAAPLPETPEALSRASKLCRSTIPGARVELIFQNLEDAQAVHEWLCNLTSSAAPVVPDGDDEGDKS